LGWIRFDCASSITASVEKSYPFRRRGFDKRRCAENVVRKYRFYVLTGLSKKIITQKVIKAPPHLAERTIYIFEMAFRKKRSQLAMQFYHSSQR
jgi:hypothetical protein